LLLVPRAECFRVQGAGEKERMASQTDQKPKARILVVDDHPLVRDGLVRLISRQGDLKVCGEASTVAETQTAVARHKPDLIILDLRLKGGGDGLELIKSLKSQFPRVRILILTQYESLHYGERALRAGALGYLIKEQAAGEVLAAIRAVLDGNVYVTRGMAGLLLHKLVGGTPQAPSDRVAGLTDRELHVLHLLGMGKSTRDIAAGLNLSIKTIESHRENIKQKLGLRGAPELVRYAHEWAGEQISLPAGAFQDASKRPEP